MNGWQRFFLLLMCEAGVLVCWPDYGRSGVLFLVMAGVLWTCIIMLLSVISNIFGIYKFELLNRLVSLAFLAVLAASFLYYFPLENTQTPWTRLQSGRYPTTDDMSRGLRRLANGFHLVQDRAQDVNEKLDGASDALKKTEKSVKKQKEKLDIIVEQLED